MCLIIFAHQAESRYPLVLAANRDEFFARPTEQAGFWQVQPNQSNAQQILAGRDLLAGGTWLGITRSSRFAAVTNIRDPSQSEQKSRSRGELTREFLASTQSAQEYGESLVQHFSKFAGFNLLIGDGESLYYANNFEHVVWRLEPGIYGLSNGLLNTPWPKVERGKERLKEILGSNHHITTDKLIELMADRKRASDDELPDTGVPAELEKTLSSAFILNKERLYGTRCSTAIVIDAEGETCFSEQNYDSFGETAEQHTYNVTLA